MVKTGDIDTSLIRDVMNKVNTVTYNQMCWLFTLQQLLMLKQTNDFTNNQDL